MKEERTNAEKRFWQMLMRIAVESGFEPGWAYLGYPCPRKRITELMERFHGDISFPGFYGIRIPLGEVNGTTLNLLIENQKELIVGIQAEDTAVQGSDKSVDSLRSVMSMLVETGRQWDFEAPGWIAWKTTEIRLNFRSVLNRAFQDIMLMKSDSEALYLIGEEVSDILNEMKEIIFKQEVEYGTVIN